MQWTTHEQATTIVQYDAVVGDGRLDRQRFGDDASDHSVTLTDLAPNTEHELRVLSADASGNGPTASPVVRFRTAALPDATPPVIVGGPKGSH